MRAAEPANLFYYAYGSNLHPARLGARIPSSQLIGVVELTGYQLAFHKRGTDLSAKCNAVNSGAVTDSLFGALFSISAAEKSILDEVEGPGYVVVEVMLEHAGQLYQAFMYVAERDYIDDSLIPYQWYKDLVYFGACFLELPDHYVSRLGCVDAVEDTDGERHARNESVLQLMR